MEFLRSRRLELARTRLLSSPESTVTEIALDCGFGHLGRFSIQYRAHFGEGPLQTRSRARAGRADVVRRRRAK
jgi:transcriptional regulator GlxA family with amidase domain